MPLEYALQNSGRFSSASAWHQPHFNMCELSEALGIDYLPKQRIQRIKRSAFVLNLMVAGETGLGKTTFMNTLFNTDITENVNFKVPQKTDRVQVLPKRFDLSEDNVVLNLTVIDTPGFGDRLNRETDLAPIVEYIDTQFESYLQQETRQDNRNSIEDTRVHALLYFVAPGSGLRDIDILTLQQLSNKVNIIPVIAKCDTMKPDEKLWNKKLILNQLKVNNIKTYLLDYCDEGEVIEESLMHYPFAVMGSQAGVQKNGEIVRGRKYRWGVVEVDNPEHCDFVHLQAMLMQTCLVDLIDSTNSVHYFQFRATRMRSGGRPESILACDDEFMNRLESRKIEFTEDMLRKEEELRLKFVNQVREKEQALKNREEQLHINSQRLIAEMEQERIRLEQEQREIDSQLAQRNL